MKIDKQPLPFEDYNEFGIDQRYSAYSVQFLGVDEKQAEDLEFEYQQKGYKIFFSEMQRTTSGHFDLKVIVAKLDFVF